MASALPLQYRQSCVSFGRVESALPLYAYRCTSCGHRFEKIQSFSAEPEKVCPKCGKETLVRPLTAPRFQFKGAGWYVNDYAPASSESSAESSGETKPAESKDASKSSKPAGDSSSSTAAPSAPASTPKTSGDS